ncbi:hypothetical protein Pfo_016716 [Paulownia fortunei]|nr:hypothetical protein Pfo_016716 [Paulownia fortunei]
MNQPKEKIIGTAEAETQLTQAITFSNRPTAAAAALCTVKGERGCTYNVVLRLKVNQDNNDQQLGD